MKDDVLRVAVIGMGGAGQRTLEALQQCRNVEVVGIADKDPTLTERTGTEG